VWCPESRRVVEEVCKRVAEGVKGFREAANTVKGLVGGRATCIEDSGRELMKRGDLEECVEALESIDPEELRGDRFALELLFSMLFTYYRRLRIEDKMENLLKIYEKYLRDTPIYLHARAMWVEKSSIAPFEDRLLLAISYELKALELDPDYIGAQHKLADLVVQALEEGWTIGDCPRLEHRCVPRSLVAKCREYLRSMAYELGYPRAYYTLARYNIIEGNYAKAIELLSQAIRLEPANTKDYSFRLAEYYNTLLLARSLQRIERSIASLNRGIEEQYREMASRMAEKIEGYESRLLSFISIFTAIITIVFTFAFAVSSSQLSFTEALYLEIIMILSIITLIIILLSKLEGKRYNRERERQP